MVTKLICMSLAVFALGAGPALCAEPVAQVLDVQGKVLLNGGDGFQTVEKMATVNVGDQLLVSKDATVSLQYASAGCASTFKDPALLTVSSSAPCANQPGAKRSRSFNGGGGGAAVSGAAQRASTPFSVPSLGGGTTTTTSAPQPTPKPASLP